MAEQPKGVFESLVTSSVVAALVTVLGTAVVGNYIAGRVQERNKRNEIALSAFRDNQASQVALVKEVYELIGRYRAAGEDLIYITGDQFAAGNYDEPARKLNQAWFTSIRNHHDEVDQLWRQKKYALGYLLSFHYHGRKEVADSWATTVTSADAFEECVDQQARKAPGSQSLKDYPCRAQMRTLDDQVASLTRTLESDNVYLWEEVRSAK